VAVLGFYRALHTLFSGFGLPGNSLTLAKIKSAMVDCGIYIMYINEITQMN
jgi:hypothetical protein